MNSRFWGAVFALVFCGGCGAGSFDPAGSARVPLKSDNEFRISIRPQAADPRLVDVWVESSDPQVWDGVPVPGNGAQRRPLVTLRLATSAEPESSDASAASAGMPGELAIIDGQLRFRPAFPLLAGERYVAEFNPGSLPGVPESRRRVLSAEYLVSSSEPQLAPEVTAIYPSGSELPANHLKFYVLFSQPMRQGEIWDYFTLFDETLGQPVPSPFRHTELWSEDGRRLTLWFHPGRQKTGVNLNVEIGSILEPGHRYSLIISRRWLDQHGGSFKSDVRKTFRAAKPEHGRVDPGDWTITAPAPGARDTLAVRFPRPLDWSLLQRELHVETTEGNRIEGRVVTGPAESSWSFAPAAAWAAGEYQLVVGPVLEDLAGNSVARPFEVDLSRAASPPNAGATRLKFTIGTTAPGRGLPEYR